MTLLLAADGSGSDRDKNLAINQAIKGKLNCTGTVTLTHDVASTVVTNELVSSASAIFLFPRTAESAAALATTYIAPADTVDKVSFKITHANNSQTDRQFSFVILG